MKPSVAIIRGEALNPFEMQAYVPLQAEFDLVLIGRRHPSFETALIPLPSHLLGSVAIHRSVRRGWRWAYRRKMVHRDPDYLFGLNRLVRSRQILHAVETAIPVSEQAADICASSGAKLVLTCWETIPFRYDDNPLLRRRKQKVQEMASLFIAVTSRAKLALLEEGIDESRIAVVPAAIDCNRFHPDIRADEFADRWEVKPDDVVILYMGRLVQEKGVVELVRSFARTMSRRSRLFIAGSGDQRERVEHAAAVLGVAARVTVLPAVSYSAVPGLYAMADIVVVPSLPTPYWEEQFGMVLAEAMASGRAVIATASGAIPEVVGDAASIVRPYDIDDLTAHLDRLIEDKATRAQVGARAREFALASYSVDAIAPRIAACYRKVLTT